MKGHKCKKPQSFRMIAEEEESGDYDSEPKFDKAPGKESETWQE